MDVSSRSFAVSSLNPRLAREWAAGLVIRAGHDARASDARIVVSELVANAVRHGDTAGDDVVVTVAVRTERMRFGVTDHAPGRLPRPVAAPDERGGFGLRIVAALSSEWGVDQFAENKTVRAELALADDDGGPPLPAGARERRRAGAAVAATWPGSKTPRR